MNLNPKLTHVTFQVKNIDESLPFYKKWFGLEVHRDRRPSGRTVWIAPKQVAKKDVPEFVFVISQADEVSRINHFGFQVESREMLDEIAQKAKKEGVHREGPIDVGGVVGSFLFIEDPSGHLWEFTCGQPIEGL